MRAQRGWTLIELFIVATILAILAGVAARSLGSALEGARASKARANLLASLSSAAAHAALTGTRAVLCPTLDAEHCSDDPDWSSGWLVFMDTNASRDHDGGERVLSLQGRLSGRVRLRSTAGRSRIVFQGNGGNVGSNVTFTLCDGRGPNHALSLIMANNGRLREATPSAESLLATCPR